MPELRLPFGEIPDLLLITLDAINPKILTTDQHRDFRPGMAGDRELMQYLALVGDRHAFFPLRGTVIASGLDFEDAGAVGVAYHLPVEVGEHEQMLGVLEYRIDPAYPIAGAFGVDLCQHWLQLDAPQHGLLVGDIVRLLAPGLLQP
ncbi:hypothetical protein D3C84_652780 [compost metagenome]